MIAKFVIIFFLAAARSEKDMKGDECPIVPPIEGELIWEFVASEHTVEECGGHNAEQAPPHPFEPSAALTSLQKAGWDNHHGLKAWSADGELHIPGNDAKSDSMCGALEINDFMGTSLIWKQLNLNQSGEVYKVTYQAKSRKDIGEYGSVNAQAIIFGCLGMLNLPAMVRQRRVGGGVLDLVMGPPLVSQGWVTTVAYIEMVYPEVNSDIIFAMQTGGDGGYWGGVGFWTSLFRVEKVEKASVPKGVEIYSLPDCSNYGGRAFGQKAYKPSSEEFCLDETIYPAMKKTVHGIPVPRIFGGDTNGTTVKEESVIFGGAHLQTDGAKLVPTLIAQIVVSEAIGLKTTWTKSAVMEREQVLELAGLDFSAAKSLMYFDASMSTYNDFISNRTLERRKKWKDTSHWDAAPHTWVMLTVPHDAANEYIAEAALLGAPRESIEMLQGEKLSQYRRLWITMGAARRAKRHGIFLDAYGALRDLRVLRYFNALDLPPPNGVPTSPVKLLQFAQAGGLNPRTAFTCNPPEAVLFWADFRPLWKGYGYECLNSTGLNGWWAGPYVEVNKTDMYSTACIPLLLADFVFDTREYYVRLKELLDYLVAVQIPVCITMWQNPNDDIATLHRMGFDFLMWAEYPQEVDIESYVLVGSPHDHQPAPYVFNNLVWGQIENFNTKLANFLRHFSLPAGTLNKIISNVTTGQQRMPGVSTFKLSYAAACAWVRGNLPLWQKMLEFKCQKGYGQHGDDCRPCDPGHFSSEGDNECQKCPVGKYTETRGRGWCTDCDLVGRIKGDTGATSCAACDKGYFQDDDHNMPCKPCPPGTSQSSIGSSQCEHCPIGSFSPLEGQASCFSCSNVSGWSELTTVYRGSKRTTDCVCRSNTFYDHRLRGCILCNEKPNARICSGGAAPLRLTTRFNADLVNSSVVDLSVVVLEGFMATDANEFIHVYRCRSLGVCAGMRQIFTREGSFNTDGMCTGHAEGIACGRCKAGFSNRDGACASCSNFKFPPDTAWFVCSVGTLVVVTYVYYISMFKPDPVDMASGTVLEFIQAAGVVTGFGMVYSDLVEMVIVRPLQRVIRLDVSIFEIPADCITGQSYLYRYVGKLMAPVIWLLTFLVVFATCKISRLLAEKLLQRPVSSPLPLLPNVACIQKPLAILRTAAAYSRTGITLDERIGWFWPITGPDSVNAIIKTQGTLFIGLTKLGMETFRVEKHPTGEKTLASFKDVQVGQAEHKSAMPFAIAALAGYSLSYFALCLYLVYVAPRRVASDPVFRRNFRCLWAKFDPDAWWFCAVHLFFAILLNLLPAIITNARILVITTILLLCYLMLLTAFIHPWKYRLNHIADIGTKMGLTIFVLMYMNLDVGEKLDTKMFDVAMAFAALSPIILVVFQVVHFIWRHRVAKLQELEVRATFAQQLNDIMHIVGTKPTHELRSYAMTLLDNDVDRLSQALDTLQFTMLGLQSTKYLRWRCAPVPFEVVTSGRLEGEMIALGILDKGDARECLRKLKSALLSSREVAEGTEETGRISRTHFSTCSTLSYLHQTVKNIFTDIGVSNSETVGVEDFVSALQGRVHSFNREDLANIFIYLDIDQDGRVSKLDFVEALHTIHEPVMPKWWKPTSPSKEDVVYV